MAQTGKTIAELDTLSSPVGSELLVVQVGSENKKVTAAAVSGLVNTTYTAGANVSITGTVISATDTTYSVATGSSNGLMSKDDFTKLAGVAENATKNSAGSNVSIDGNGVISATDTTYLPATDLVNGLMSAADKSKLDNIDDNATKNSAGTNISIDGNGVISATIPLATVTVDGGIRARLVGSVLYLTNNGVDA